MDIRTADRTGFHTRLARIALAALLALGSLPLAAQDLAPGEFEWTQDAAPDGRVVLVVSLPEQRMHVYRGGIRIGVSTISSGRTGHETPTGVFEIVEKRRTHHSNLYDDAPMPFMQRLTWDGIALHAGRIPGYPASHGCIRLPDAFAERLFEMTEKETIVVVADELSHGPDVVFPGERVPVNPVTGLANAEPGPVELPHGGGARTAFGGAAE